MLATLHNITDAIIIRKSLKWKNCFLTDDEKTDCNNIFNQMQLRLNKYLSKLSKNIKNTDLVSHCIRNVYSIKSRLQENEWPLPCTLTQNEQKVYLHDFNFYLMLCGILTKATTLFKGYFPSKDRLSYAQTLPVIKGNSRRIVQTINLLPETPWMHTIQIEQQKNKFVHSLELIDQKISELVPSSPAYSFLSDYRMSIKGYPVNLKQEKHMVKTHLNILQIVDEYSNEDSYYLVRELMHEGFQLGWLHEETKNKYFKYYNDGNLINKDFTDEIKNLKSAQKKCKRLLSQKMIKNERIINHINEIITQLSQNINNEKVSNEYIEWTHNPKDFVKAIHKFISKGYMNFKGNTDMQPIVEQLTRFIKVRKLNNSGNLTTTSLLTYFKKANCGDLI